ncbi:cytochrome P450 [Streptomyces sp. NPDC048277]|uniref:cytochrome P450 family protein n=1 Tax=Streptomyces sp. NPDC048277 TaxID=3155027 RepID=UPI00340B12EC
MDHIQEITRQDGTTVLRVTGYDAARQALSERRTTKVLDVSSMGYPPDLHDAMLRQMLFLDPPDHTRLRRMVSASFTAQRIEAMRSRIDQLADELLDAMGGHETVDLIQAYAWPLPLQVICDLLGVPADSREAFRTWTTIVAAGPTRHHERPAQLTRLLAVVRGLLADRRAHPGDDLLSDLIAARDDQDRLSEDELTSMVFMLLVAGHETTVNLIGNGVFRLLEDRSRWDRVRAEPQLLATAIEEFVRYDPPLAMATSRTAAETFELAGRTVRAGTPVDISLAQAHRDENRFPNADQLQLDRHQNPHLGFGHGIHYCLGAQLARLEGRVAFTALMTRFPDLDLAVPATELTWRHDFMRGLDHLPVRTQARTSIHSGSSTRRT